MASVGLHQINHCVDIADWIVGEIQRLVMDGITNNSQPIGVVTGTDGRNKGSEEWLRESRYGVWMDEETISHLIIIAFCTSHRAIRTKQTTREILKTARDNDTQSLTFNKCTESQGRIKYNNVASSVFDGGVSLRFRWTRKKCTPNSWSHGAKSPERHGW